MRSLSIIMPALNEEQNLRAAILACLGALEKFRIDGEIIVVNDGSTDHTGSIAAALAAEDSRIRTITHDRPHGVGSSFWDGVMAARNEFVTMIPGDNENDPVDALTYFYMADDVDIIVPFIHNIEIRSYVRRIISSLYRFIINVSFGMNLNYTNGTVIYHRRVLQQVTLDSPGFFYQAELLIKLIRAGYLYAETPHFLAVRGSGKTKALTIKSLRQVVAAYIGLMWRVHVARTAGKTDTGTHPDSATYRRSIGAAGST